MLKMVLKMEPKNLPALHILGLINASQANYRDAANFLSRAARINPQDASIQYNLAKALLDCGSEKESIPHHKKAVELSPSNPDAWINYGKTSSNLGRHEEALSLYDKVLSLKPDYADAWSNKGGTLKELKRFEEAITHYDKALSLKPDYAEGWAYKATTLHELKRFEEAITHYDKALSLKPDYAEGWAYKATTLHELKRFDEAITHYDKALSLKPDYAEGWANRGVTLHELKRFDEAITHYDKALSLKPDYAEGWANKANTFNYLKRHEEAAESYLKAFEVSAEDNFLLSKAHHQMMLSCDWTNYDKYTSEIFNTTNRGGKGSEPFGLQGIACSEELLKKCAEIYSKYKYPTLGNLSEYSKYQHNKIRIGYLCGEFRDQATSVLMARIWELHDKSKFEIFAFDSGWDDDSAYRHRIKVAFNNIYDISQLSDLEAANLIRSNEIDILVNLNGFFGQLRQGVFSYKPAPIQVNYLGFPGTLGAPYIDYIIADKVVIPEESKKHYMEKVAYLPNSYQSNDNQRIISRRQFTKVELGLPDNGFVFACFNNNYKITPSTFDSWARILTSVPESVLWLLADNPISKENLIKAATDRGLNSARLIFADRVSISEHLARHHLADLFIDTLPYNAHTTCSDALWAGLPVLTLMGNTFPGRVAASLLKAVGLDELITYSEREYELMAIQLATDPVKLKFLRDQLSSNLSLKPLFNSDLFTENLEAVYTKMHERQQMNLQPEHIDFS
nr:tetratricopeptide repeat protein [Polynucleobacter asymbioticus]